jgi:hypothetical protein
VRNRFLEPLTFRDIDAQVSKVLKGLGNPTPPLNLDEVRELLRLDRQYYSSSDEGALKEFISRIKIAGKQISMRPRLILDVVRKLDLKALWLPDRKRILLDSDQPRLKWRWNEAHELGHSIIEWHKEYLHGDSERTLTPSCHAQIEAEANFAAGRLLFLQHVFEDYINSSTPSFSLVQAAHKQFGNTLTSTLWRMTEALRIPALSIVSHHPHYTGPSFDSSKPCRYFVRSRSFEQQFSNVGELEIFGLMRSHCSWRRTGPIAHNEVSLSDDRGDQHIFSFEAFSHKYEMLSLFSYLKPDPSAPIPLRLA